MGKAKPKAQAPAAGKYTLVHHGATVAQGSYSALTVTFRAKAKGENYDELTLFIPAHDGFQVGYNSTKGAFTSVLPKAPFTISAAQTAGIKDRFKRPRPMRVSFTRWIKVASDTWSTREIAFTACKVQVASISIKDNGLTLSGGFGCNQKKPAFKAVGTFAVKSARLGSSKVD